MSTTATNPSVNDATQNDDEIDLIALLLTLLRGWKTILTCALLGLILGVTYSRYVQPTYQTDALLQIDEKSSGIAALGANISELVGESKSQAETERELIKSRMVLDPVVSKLHLDLRISNPEIGAIERIVQSEIPTQTSTEQGVLLETSHGAVQISSFEVPLAYLNKPFTIVKTDRGFEISIEINEELLKYSGNIGSLATIKTPEGDIKISVISLPEEGHPISLTKLSISSAIDELSNNLAVAERGKQTGIVQLTLSGEDQKQVSRVLANVVQSYVDQNLARGSEQTSTTIKFMESQIPQLKQKLQQSEEAFNKFREKYGTIDVSKEAEILLEESSKLELQLSELKLKQAELLTYYTEEHPLVIQINDQIAVLNKRRQEIKETVTRMPDTQRQFLQLSQDMEINREIYLTMLKNYEQLKIARAGEIGYVRVVDMPINTYKPIAPKKPIIWAIALLLGTMLGTLLVLLYNILRKTIKDPDQLEAKTGVPVIATIPTSKSVSRLAKGKQPANRLLTHVEHDGLSYEAIKSLRTSLMFGLMSRDDSGSRGKMLMITGESPGIGKSFITANLAEVFSQLNKKVLVIDGDMRLGHLHKTFIIDQHVGLADYLMTEDAVISDFIHPTSYDYIDFMPRGRKPFNPGSLLTRESFTTLMQQVATHYDYILIDTPPVLAASDAMVIAQFADQVLMVARYNQSIEGQVAYAIKQLNKANVTVDGIVINDMKQGIMDKYSYHYSYAYGEAKD